MATSFARTILTKSWRYSSSGSLYRLSNVVVSPFSIAGISTLTLSVSRRPVLSEVLLAGRTDLFSSSGRLRWGSAFISTSGKNKDAASVAVTDKTHGNVDSKTAESLAEKEENWISYGYSLVDRDEDEWAHHLITFLSVTVVLCWGSFFIAYYPDFKDHAWAQREAYLELEHREKAGLPLIDPNMIDPAKIPLPSDEELADFEIII